MAVAAACVLVGAVAGGFVPAWVARLPEPADATGPTYAELARWPGLRPVAVVLAALECGLVGVRFGADAVVPALCYVCLIGVVVGYVDVRVHLLPNAIVLPSYPVLAALLLGAAAWERSWTGLVWAAVGGVALWGFFMLLLLVYPAGMGFGDVKLAGLLGLALGWLGFGHVVLGLFAAFVLGGLAGLTLILARRAHRRSAIPFGPFLLAGFAVAALLGDPIVNWYLGR